MNFHFPPFEKADTYYTRFLKTEDSKNNTSHLGSQKNKEVLNEDLEKKERFISDETMNQKKSYFGHGHYPSFSVSYRAYYHGVIFHLIKYCSK